jgi:hypothetical protein
MVSAEGACAAYFLYQALAPLNISERTPSELTQSESLNPKDDLAQ